MKNPTQWNIRPDVNFYHKDALPSDINDPTRRNTVNPNDFPDNEYNLITIDEEDC